MTPSDSPPDVRPAPLRGDIAIVGMGCLFAGAPNLDTYWQNILGKVDAISDPPAGEWDPSLFYDPESKSNDRVYCKRGGYIGDISDFRPTDFGIMPIAVDGGEPDQWLALRVAHEALADAGYTDAPREHIRTEVVLGKGTYVNRGNLTVGYHGMIVEHFLQALKNLHPEYTNSDIGEIRKELKAGLPPFNADTAPALIGNIIAGRIANRLDFMGPSFTVDAACASALLAIEIGVHDLLSHKYDLVLAGGANVNAPLPTMSLFCQLGALSRQEKIRPFDKDADGTILGEGVGMVVLKRREDAERDGNRIYAILKGVGVASDGRAVHVMAPRVEGEELALRRAYEMAGVEPNTIGLIEAHGTATPVGDVVEIQALSRVFGERHGVLPSCALGSVKSMIGHTMPAAGIAGVIKTALALYHRVLPPTLNCEEPNPALKLQQTPFYVNTETRPWIHGADTPRRAGVNSFGFGGINAHAVLEEYTPAVPVARSHQLQWETEVCIVEASSRSALMERVGHLKEFLSRAGETSLKDLASTLNSSLVGQPSRLAVVATSLDDLAQKLSLALGRLADPKCRQIKDNSGVYFFDQPLQGKLAFLFPGEGAQYPNMLLDLCLHFPEVRSCFDAADRALRHGSPNVLPSEFIFPRSILSKAERRDVEEALWQIDGAVEAVLIGNWAMWTLLNCLEIRPDVIAGHSTGDYSAMLASKIISLPDVLQWNKENARLSAQMPVPQATLIAVAADAATAMSIAHAVSDDLHLAMDNCPHQSVIAGSKESADRVIEVLRSRGIIYEILPFDRPYHTPLFGDYARGVGDEFFARLPIAAPGVETYSCTTAARYPTDLEGIRDLFVAHWVRPVLFTGTVKQMYDDGVRLFVEAGPRGNLTAFVSDILRGKPHLAMPANLPRRSGITQLNHLIGILAAQGVGMRTDYLYARRGPQVVDWEAAAASVARRQSPAMKLKLALPPLKVSPRPAKVAVAPPQPGAPLESRPPQPRNRPPAVEPVPDPMPSFALSQRPVAGLPMTTAAAQHMTGVSASPQGAPRALAPKDASAAVMREYLKSMEAFLDTESQVMGAVLSQQRAAQAAKPVPPSTPQAFPLLGTVTLIVPGQELTAVRQLTHEDDLFLGDHALGGGVSVTDPGLKPLVVVPLTISMELLAEAAAALMPGQVLVGMRDIQAHHWIQVDRVPVTLQISARRIAASANEVLVQIRNASDGSSQANRAPVIEGVMIFAGAYAPPPAASGVNLQAERRSSLALADLYDGRLMFHGPCFQGVAGIQRSGSNGMTGQLRTLSPENLFRSIPDPKFVTDPVLLDAAGQLVGYWSAEYLPRGFVVFPYRLERLHIYGPNRPAGELVTCSLSLMLKGNEAISSDIEIATANGAVWMRLEGWADRRFDPPPQFHRAWVAPCEAAISEPWETPLKAFRDKELYECRRLDALFAPGPGLWKELWASLILSQRERGLFREHRAPELRQMEWLSGRTVVKDAVRSFLSKRYGLELLPADIEIVQDEFGKLSASGPWTPQVLAVPEIALSQSGSVAVALVCEGGTGRQVGIHVQAVQPWQPDFESIALTPAEELLLKAAPEASRHEWLLRIWCAKEAASKALGLGPLEGPRSVEILSLDLQTGVATAAPGGKLAEAGIGVSPDSLLVFTARDGELAVASAVIESEHHEHSPDRNHSGRRTEFAQPTGPRLGVLR